MSGILFLVLILGAGLGCGPATPELERLAIAHRLIEEDPTSFFDRTALLDRTPIETWSFRGAADLEPWQPMRFDRKFELGLNELILHSTRRRPRLLREVDWQTESVDALVLEVPGFARGIGRLFWAAEGEEFSQERSLAGRLIDGVFPLPLVFDVVFHSAWRGRIRRIAIELYSPESVEFRLRTVNVVRYQPVAERLADAALRSWKIDLDHEVRSGLLALPGAPVARRMEIPPEAVLRVGFATGAGARRPIVFSGTLEIDGAETTTLFEAIVDPDQPQQAGRWQDREVDLSAFAGAEATLRLETRAAGGDHDLVRGFAFWSGPEVLRRAPERSASPALNVVLISIDTLRADHLPLYGYARSTAPRLAEWASRRAVTFRAVVAASPWTIPSHVSIFSGLDALRHGVNHPAPIPDRLELLAELFRDAGYGTLAITGGGFMQPQRGFVQGFDRYRYWPDPKSEAELDDGIGRALEWLDDFDDRPFLLFFHTFEVHHPFRRREPYFTRLAGEQAALRPEIHIGLNNAPSVAEEGFLLRRKFFWKPEKKVIERSPVSAAELEEIVGRYDSGIAFTDDRLGRLLARLEERGLDRRTVVVVTSDHGDALGERGFAGHAYLYDWNLLVPLVIAVPGGRGGSTIESQVRSVDLLPTLLDLADLPAPPNLDGVSLVPLLEGREEAHPPAAWSYAAFSNRGLALRIDNRLKYHFNNTAWAPLQGREELYDLRRDPEEEHDLAAGAGDTAELRRRVRRRLEQVAVGLEVRFTNVSDRVYGGRIGGIAVHPTTVKAEELPAGAVVWREVGSADFRVRPGDDFRLRLERLDGRPLRFEGAFDDSRDSSDAFEAKLEVAGLKGAWRLTSGDAGWSEGAGDPPERVTGIVVRWRGGDGSPLAESETAADPGLAEQLRALGYVNNQ